MYTKQTGRFDIFVGWGKTGQPEDVDRIMVELATGAGLGTIKLADYALSLVSTRSGRERLLEYLFKGVPIQRNYAALYFKRRGIYTERIEEAVLQGLVDSEMVYAR